MPDEATRKRVVNEYCRRMNEGDLAGTLALFGENATFEDPLGAKPLVGREAISAHLRHAIDGKVHEEPDEPVAAMDREHVAITATVTVSAPHLPADKRLRYRLASIVRVGPSNLIEHVQVMWGRSDAEVIDAG